MFSPPLQPEPASKGRAGTLVISRYLAPRGIPKMCKMGTFLAKICILTQGMFSPYPNRTSLWGLLKRQLCFGWYIAYLLYLLCKIFETAIATSVCARNSHFGDMKEYKYSFEVCFEYILTQRSWASPPPFLLWLKTQTFPGTFLASQLHVALVVEPVPGAERRRCI